VQQINLYQDEFKHIEPPYSANMMVLLALMTVLAGVLLSVFLAVIMWWWQGGLTENKNDWNDWKLKLQQSKVNFPEPQADARLTRNITGFKLDIVRNNQVLKYLQSQQLSAEQQSFSVLLLALTQVSEKELWLTDIKIRKGGASLSLEGRALSAESLPNYLKKLSDLEVFRDMKFRVFEMTRENESLSFVVSSDRGIQGESDLIDFLGQDN